MSNLLAVYTALSTTTVNVGSVTPSVRTLATLPDKVESAQCPIRLLLPLGVGRGEGRSFSFITIGTTAKPTWHITDLLLWRVALEGIGLQTVAEDLVRYCAAYVEMLRSFRNPATQCILKEANLTIGKFEWPSASGQWFFGVECRLDIDEVLTGV